MGSATKAQKCKYCDQPAERSLIWAEGRAYIPVCRAHEQKARNRIRSNRDSVCDVKRVEQGPIAYREHQFNPRARMEQALEPALAFVEDEEPGTYFGLQADPERAESAFQEAPAEPLPRAAIGRRSTVRGTRFPATTGKEIQGVKGTIRQRRGPAPRRTTGDKPHQVAGREIPDSLLQMLGTDWKNMRAHRVHDNRMTVSIDGVRFSVYTRRG